MSCGSISYTRLMEMNMYSRRRASGISVFFFSSRRRHTRCSRDWSSDVCSSDLQALVLIAVTTVKVFVFDVSRLDRGYRIVSFIVLGALLLAISFVYQRDWLQLSGDRKSVV